MVILCFAAVTFIAAQSSGAEYLIITHDNYWSDIQPLAQWRNRAGLRTKVVKLSQIGSSASQIYSYIYNAYYNWTIKPKYILLVGAPNYLPFPTIGTVYTDNYYTNMNGDVYNEILSGRLTVHSSTECQTVVAKILRYERYPDTTNDSWFGKACLIANFDNDPNDDSIYINDVRYAAQYMVNNGFSRIDTLSDYYGHNYNNVYAAVNNGRGFLMYRGSGTNNWYTPFDCNPDVVTNGNQMPIVLSFTCNTIGRSSTPAAAERWFLTGSPTLLRGGAGYFATTTSITNGAYLRSAVCRGFMDGVFAQRKTTFGEACEAGRMRVYQMYGSATEYYGFNTIGDPAMRIWTSAPRPLSVTHDSVFFVGDDTFSVLVQHQGTPVESAYVCLVFDTLIFETGYTDANGIFTRPLNFPYPGNLLLTITGRNYYPYERDLSVIETDAFLAYGHCRIVDSLGNNNRVINSGENIQLWTTIRDLGICPALGVTAWLRSSDSLIYITDSAVYYGTIPGNDSSPGLNPFVFSVSPRAPTHVIPFTLYITDADHRSWSYDFTLPCTGNSGGGNGTGPDAYGYYMYDNTDSLTGQAPVYDWFEIATPAGGPGQIIPEITNADGDTVTLPLPFTFRYYGLSYNSIGACSNGFLEVGHSTSYTSTNTSLPNVGGPKRTLAGFWDNLNVGTQHMGHGDIYQYHDIANHRWIIEFYQAARYDNYNEWETFQMILRDPAYYPTPTSDGEILFVYQFVENPTSATVGFEDETETRGLQYVYNNSYDPNAAPLVSGRAILITTKPPLTGHSPWLHLSGYTVNDSLLGNNNGIADPGETLLVTVTIRNGGDTLAEAVNGQLINLDSEAEMLDSVSFFGDILPGASADNAADPYLLQVAETPADSTISLLLTMTTSDTGYVSRHYLTIYITIALAVHEQTDHAFSGQYELSAVPNPGRNRIIFKLVPNAACRLNNNYPSPASERMELKIYDVTGRVLKSWPFSALSGAVSWDGTDFSGHPLPAGIYFARVAGPDYKIVKKVILLK